MGDDTMFPDEDRLDLSISGVLQRLDDALT